MNNHEGSPPAAAAPLAAPALSQALVSGGDERLAIDPRTGRNRYGIRPGEAPAEVAFGSSTASPLSRRGRLAAEASLARLLGGSCGRTWMETIRDRLRRHLGFPACEVVLTASGTEAELVTLALATTLLGRALTTIVVAPDETGSGVPLAAAGRHFLGSASLAACVTKGTPLAGLADRDIRTEGVAIRDPDGRPLPADHVDAAVADRVEAALRNGRDVVIHRLDTSKTGLSGLRGTAAAALAAAHPDRILVVVDACQMRCSAAEVRRDLQAGFVVLVTGSKFLAGPPFAGAVLIPPAVLGRLDRLALPAGLAAYSAEHDWPAPLRARMAPWPFATSVNMGLGLRWEAALAEADALLVHPRARRRAVTAELGAMIREAVQATPGLLLLEGSHADPERLPTIFPVITHAASGAALCARTLHQGLLSPGPADPSARVFHVGQPVAVGDAAALRICIGAPHIVEVADRLAAGASMDAAIAPVATDLAALLDKWLRLTAGAAPARRSA